MSKITTHVLDTSSGRPAAGVKVKLSFQRTETWEIIAEGITDNNGRIKDLLKDNMKIENGFYRLQFDTGAYYSRMDKNTLYPYVEIIFDVKLEEHYHIPLLISPFGYSTYRGS